MVTKKIGCQELEQRDIILVILDPTKGHEQRDYRPFMVLTKNSSYLNYMYGAAPITSKSKRFPLNVPLPEHLATEGEVSLEHHRMIDLETRDFSFVEKASKELMEECSVKIKLVY